MSGASNARQAALFALGRCRRDGAWSPQALSAAAAKYKLDRRDTALSARLCRTVLQNASLCDFYIDSYSSMKSGRLEPQLRDILRLGICQLVLMDRIPQSAAVSESVELAKSAGLGRAAGLVNAVLRRVAGAAESLPEIPGRGSPAFLSVRYSEPLWLCERLIAERGYAFAEAFFAASNREAPLCVTVNALRTDAESLLRELREQHAAADAQPYMPQSLLLHGAGALEDIAAHRDGRFFVQDAGAALAVLAAAPKAGMCVLDGCAAPGGKSFLAGIRMESRGEILACDLREKKLSLIQDGAVRLGLSLIETRVMDAGEPDEVLRGRFDLVLADVPCSGLGVMRRKPEIRFRDPEELARLPDVQRRILRGLAACVAPGGTLLYSTCTVLEAENEGVVGAFLMENEEFSMEPFELPGIGKTGGSVMLWPHVHGTDGFFICRLRKRNV